MSYTSLGIDQIRKWTETLNINSSSITITDNDTDNATNTITTTEQSLVITHR